MIKGTNSKQILVLAIAPSTRGVGFAVLEGQGTLVDWGVKSVKGDKNIQSLVKVEELIALYRPEVLVLQDYSAKHSRRSVRIRGLGQQIVSVASRHEVRAKLFSREQVSRVFFGNGQGTKHALAEILAKQYPEELSLRLPPKRKPWMSEDYRMDIFEAVSLAITFYYSKGGSTPKISLT